jgi:4-amino-4-deoxy-L-arabinose transferase-like glycosyltransferase
MPPVSTLQGTARANPLRRLIPAKRRPLDAAGWALVAILVAGLALRLLAIVSWWPTTVTLDDGYQVYAGSNPFADPQHPAGYGLILGALGAVTREVAAPVLLQHMTGFAAALLLWDATRRVTGSRWAGLLPAAAVLLNPDQIFLEHSIMSESWAVLATSAGLYAAVRAFDATEHWWRWPLLAGVALGLAVTIRTAGLLMIPVVLVALVLCRPRSAGWRVRLGPAVVAAAGAGAILIAFASANAAFGPRFGIGPSPGWYLYGRVAQFADCREFTPPRGTEALCDERPPSARPEEWTYLFDARSPAPRQFGGFGQRDELVGDWARRALRAQPGDYARQVWQYLRVYWVPGWDPPKGTPLDPQLDYTYTNPYFTAGIEQRLESYYDPFTVHPRRGGLDVLRGWQRVGRFGATALTLATLLTIAGLAIGTRRSRAAVVLFGLGGLALIVAPALGGTYAGRYTVPMAGPLMAAAAIAIVELLRRFANRPRGDRPAAARQ